MDRVIHILYKPKMNMNEIIYIFKNLSIEDRLKLARFLGRVREIKEKDFKPKYKNALVIENLRIYAKGGEYKNITYED